MVGAEQDGRFCARRLPGSIEFEQIIMQQGALSQFDVHSPVTLEAIKPKNNSASNTTLSVSEMYVEVDDLNPPPIDSEYRALLEANRKQEQERKCNANVLESSDGVDDSAVAHKKVAAVASTPPSPSRSLSSNSSSSSLSLTGGRLNQPSSYEELLLGNPAQEGAANFAKAADAKAADVVVITNNKNNNTNKKKTETPKQSREEKNKKARDKKKLPPFLAAFTLKDLDRIVCEQKAVPSALTGGGEQIFAPSARGIWVEDTQDDIQASGLPLVSASQLNFTVDEDEDRVIVDLLPTLIVEQWRQFGKIFGVKGSKMSGKDIMFGIGHTQEQGVLFTKGANKHEATQALRTNTYLRLVNAISQPGRVEKFFL